MNTNFMVNLKDLQTLHHGLKDTDGYKVPMKAISKV